MSRSIITTLITSATILAASTALADPGNGNGHPEMFGKGHPFSTGDLPPGRTRARLESLPGPARERAMEWLHGFDFPENDLESMVIDDEGAVLYVDPVPPPVPATDEDQAPGADGTPSQPATSAAEDAFLLHSRPDAPHVVYLDFDGHTFSGTAWNSGTIQAKPFDLDSSPSTFSDAERSAIAEIWHRVAEDYAAFDIDVTTEEPASFGPDVGRVLITSKTDANGTSMPYGSAGGVAYVGVWGRGDYASYYSPALVYYDNLAKASTYIAEACAHEFGHNLGLSHDGTTSGDTYYAGHGSGATSWAPIMGNSYYNNVTQWSNGEYAGANNAQDDLAIIAGKLDLVADDHGDALNAATPLAVDDGGQILVSNPETDPHDIYPENKGVIEVSGDQDVFRFSAAAGQVDLSVAPAWDAFYRDSRRGANLDIRASLLDGNGATLASSDPASDTDASISASVSGGIYYLAVSGVGNGNYSDYASAGKYFISGSVTPGTEVERNTPPTADFSFACMDLSCSFSDGSGDNDGSITNRSWVFGDGGNSTLQSPTHAYASAGTYTAALTVTDNGGATATATRSVTVVETIEDTVAPVVTITSPGVDTDASGRLTLSASASDNEQVARIDIHADGTLRCSGTTSASCTWNLRKVEPGTYIVRAEATDAAGNRGSASVTVTVSAGGSSKGRKK